MGRPGARREPRDRVRSGRGAMGRLRAVPPRSRRLPDRDLDGLKRYDPPNRRPAYSTSKLVPTLASASTPSDRDQRTAPGRVGHGVARAMNAPLTPTIA